METKHGKPTLEQIASLAKRRGFLFQGSELYGGIAGMWDYGPLGVALKENLKRQWRRRFVNTGGIYEIDAAIIMHPKVWEASGHLKGFTDPLAECAKCKRRFREDELENKKCPECGGRLGKPEQFNMMFATQVGTRGDSSAKAYLRPETAQGIFVNFKNIVDAYQPKFPFGVAQIGKAFRNEISPRDFLFRAREFEQMEIEYFVREAEWEQYFEIWRKKIRAWMTEDLGIPKELLFEVEVPEKERAHYSRRTVDFEFDFPFGKKELYGLAYRGDFDLKRHGEQSGQTLEYLDEKTKERFVPHVIEPTFGLDRTVLALMVSAYDEDELGGEKRVVLRLPPRLAPVTVAVFPLVRNKPEITALAKKIWDDLRESGIAVRFDDNGNIGKRYRRQDEIGTPWCVTVDHQTLEDKTVTVRDRDTGKQERVRVAELKERFAKNAF